MELLSGSGTWFKPQDMEIGEHIEGTLVSYEQDVAGSNPALPPQDVMKLDVPGRGTVTIGANASIKSTMRANPKLVPGDVLRLIYRGPTKGKKGFTFKKVEVYLVAKGGANGDTTFPPLADGASNADAEMERRLADARARRAG